MIASIADKMESYLPVLGIDEVTTPGVEAMVESSWAPSRLTAAHPYLFGGRPASGTSLCSDRLGPSLSGPWGRFSSRISRTSDAGWTTCFVAPRSAEPFWRAMRFPPPWTRSSPALLRISGRGSYPRQAVDAYCAENPDAARVPRALGEPTSRSGAGRAQKIDHLRSVEGPAGAPPRRR